MHPHHWVRSPGSSLLNDSGMVAGDGIEPSLPAYETGLGPLQLSRKKFASLFRCQRTWRRVKDSNPHQRVWNPSCSRYTNPACSETRARCADGSVLQRPRHRGGSARPPAEPPRTAHFGTQIPIKAAHFLRSPVANSYRRGSLHGDKCRRPFRGLKR